MNSNKQSLQEKIAQLSARFMSQLPARLETIQDQLQLLELEPDHRSEPNQLLLADVYRAFHGLSGTGRSFGLTDLAAIAMRAEALIRQLIESTDKIKPAHWSAEISGLLQQLEQYASCYTAPASNDNRADHDSISSAEALASDFKSAAPLVYICDDEPEQIDYLAHQLRCLGYQVEHFSQTSSFREAVMQQRPDAVIMDVLFPQGRTAGTDELARIKEATGQQLPAIVLSGSHSFESRLSAVRAGCSAYLTKPASAMELAAALDELIKDKQEEPYRILIVDDEPEVAEYHSLILENAGMVVHQIHNPTLIFEALDHLNPDLMLVDMYMPVCNGDELAALVRHIPEYVGLPIVFLSTETDVQKQFSAMQAGVEGFITKPVVPSELVATVMLRAERMRTLRGLIAKDSLTGLYNHSTTTEMLVSALAYAQRQKEPLVMVMIDLDKFKRVNDTYGHMAGDQVIVALARLLKHGLRSTDVVGRYGGEEFALVLKNISVEAAVCLLNSLREAFANVVFNAGQQQFTCTFSAGISAYPGYETAEALRLAADAALYRAKGQGRNQVIVSENEDA